MIKEHYSILFCSLTGNTKKLADAIYETLPKDKCDYFGTNDSQVPQSDVCYIGFWTDKGNADQKTLELLSKLLRRGNGSETKVHSVAPLAVCLHFSVCISFDMPRMSCILNIYLRSFIQYAVFKVRSD